ncbi:hypothetical protein Bca52824_047920 [Brassica carinata]|uniref:Uncharacterized protein n=1 Tax=Brassica carinata TaxID=52824 RepID=A0A8X7USN6_BRACI|nr:hypothetical protein Bca52824_047920 [Brassica carinata]
MTACSSSVRNNSLDASSMLLPNGSYSINANDCIRLSCEASQLRPTTWPTCPPTRCPGGESLFLGNTTSTSYANELELECPPLGSSLGHCGIYMWAAASETEDHYTVSHMLTPWQRPCSLRSLVWITSVGP